MEWFEKVLPRIVDINLGMSEIISTVNMRVIAMAKALVAYSSRSQSFVNETDLRILAMRQTT
jgi:hypothetical protein